VPRAAELAALGFQPLGEIEVRLPWQPWKHSWMMTSPFEPVTVSLGAAAWPYFSTIWPDGAYLITMASAALGNDIRTADACQLIGRGGIPVALQRHRLEGARFGLGRAYPLQIRTMEAAIAAQRLTSKPSKVLLARALRSPVFIGSLALPLVLAGASAALALVP
jgi:hypothetical protein